MSYSDELDVLSDDTVDLLTDAQATFQYSTLGSFNTTTMRNTVALSTPVSINCVRGPTRTVEVIINGKPTKVKETVWIVKASDLTLRAPAENDHIYIGSTQRQIIHVDTEVAGRQYRCTTRELG